MFVKKQNDIFSRDKLLRDDNMMKLSHRFLKYNPSSVSMDSTDCGSKYTKSFRKF